MTTATDVQQWACSQKFESEWHRDDHPVDFEPKLTRSGRQWPTASVCDTSLIYLNLPSLGGNRSSDTPEGGLNRYDPAAHARLPNP
jgi:hypothetical protein